MIHPDTIEQIRQAARIEDVVGEFVTLKKAGASLKGCCPFHSENSPSFFVTPARGIFKCFGCNEGGDSISFLMKSQSMTYPAALEFLAKKYSIEIRQTAERTDPDFDQKTQLRATMAAVQAHFVGDDANPGRKYWLGRKFTDATIDEFGLGYCAEVNIPLIDPEQLKAAGIANLETGRVSYWKRTTIPLHDGRGQLVGYAARAIAKSDDPEQQKYLYNRENILAKKSQLFFNLHRASREILRTGEVWIVEGPADCMALWQVGVKNVVAVNGMFLSDQNIADLRRFNGDKKLRLIIAIDNQPAKKPDETAEKFEGRTFIHKKNERTFLEKLLPIGEVLRVKYPKGTKDMGDWLESGKLDPNGIERKDAIETWFEGEWDKDRMKTISPGELAAFQEETAAIIAKVKNEVMMDIFIKRYSELLEIGAKKLSDMVRSMRDSKDSHETRIKLEEMRHIKVADVFLERQPMRDILTGNTRTIYFPRKVESLKEEFGPSYTKSLPRFTNYICEPSHLSYKRVIEVPHEGNSFRFFNQYEPLPREPKAFELPTGFDAPGFDYETIPEIAATAKFLKHIFDHEQYGDKYLTIGWDWLALLYLKPLQRLPAIALVSSDEGTGKSTFINLLLQIFGDNGTKTDASRIAAKFNGLGANKCLVCVEETKDEKGGIENILKDLITSFEKVVERKFMEATTVPSFEKYVFASNHEDSFMKVGSETTRFFVMKVRAIAEKEADFEQKLFVEIPYLLHFLQKRGVHTPKTDRLWFSPSLLENEALNKLRHASKDKVRIEMENLIYNLFTRTETDAPIIKLSSEYLKTLMVAYSGSIYEKQTPNYFNKVATEQMRMTQKASVSAFKMMVLDEVAQHKDLSTSNRWNFDERLIKTRALEFPVWKFVAPGDVYECWADPARLLENTAKTADPSALRWIEEVRKCKNEADALAGILPVGVEVGLPF